MEPIQQHERELVLSFEKKGRQLIITLCPAIDLKSIAAIPDLLRVALTRCGPQSATDARGQCTDITLHARDVNLQHVTSLRSLTLPHARALKCSDCPQLQAISGAQPHLLLARNVHISGCDALEPACMPLHLRATATNP